MHFGKTSINLRDKTAEINFIKCSSRCACGLGLEYAMLWSSQYHLGKFSQCLMIPYSDNKHFKSYIQADQHVITGHSPGPLANAKCTFSNEMQETKL